MAGIRRNGAPVLHGDCFKHAKYAKCKVCKPDGSCFELQQGALRWIAVDRHHMACSVQQQVQGVAAAAGQRQHLIPPVDLQHLCTSPQQH